MLAENKEKLSAAEIEPVEQALAAAKKALEGGDQRGDRRRGVQS